MKSRRAWVLTLLLVASVGGVGMQAQTPPRFDEVKRLADGQVSLRIATTGGHVYHLQTSSDVGTWESQVTFRGSPTYRFTDSAAPFLGTRFYRVVESAEPTALTGDHLQTDDGEVIIHPINHASLVLGWKDKMIYVDPVGGSSPYNGLARADLVVVTHGHPDHFNSDTLNAVKKAGTVIVGTAAVYSSMSAALRGITIPLANGADTNVVGVNVAAIGAYNFANSPHAKGDGNGYVITIGGRRIYFSGDTEDVPEMRALAGIDAAFVCMNVPYTMTVNKAANAVREFKPRIVYPYHFRNGDNSFANLTTFRQQVGVDLGIEVRQRTWY